MNNLALSSSIIGFLAVMGTWGVYLAKIPGKGVPIWPLGSIILQWIGVGLAVLALVLMFLGSAPLSTAATVLAAFALFMGVFFLWLLTQRKMPVGDIKVKVGDKLHPFELPTAEGAQFHTDEIAGKRLLLKFYRGGW